MNIETTRVPKGHHRSFRRSSRPYRSHESDVVEHLFRRKPGEAEKIDRDAQQLLEALTLQERAHARKRLSYSGMGISEIMRLYRATKDFTTVQEEYRRRIEREEDRLEADRIFRGAIFESVAHGIISSEAPLDFTVLSPQRTYLLSRALYPRADERFFGEVVRGLDNRSFCPDGLLVREVDEGPQVVGAFEISLVTHRGLLKEKLPGKYERFRHAKKRFSVFSQGAMFFHVSPRGSAGLDVSSLGQDARRIELPITLKDFNQAVAPVMSL